MTKTLECTGAAASWCPVCGDCSCSRLPSGEREDESSSCPLHGENSRHAEPGDDLPTFQLNGDARLQFWRDVYLAALPALLAKLPEGHAGSFEVLGATRLATDAADAALAQHLARNDGGELDALVGGLLAGTKRDGSK